ncbi:MAG: arginine deiminase family protein [Candidatus Palauibacterales bacterium]|nr:arginine deiminase family protein [Candidatus Palauibacterales bacterium]
MSALGQSDTLRLRSVLLKHVRDAFSDQPTVDAQWKSLGYVARPDFAAAVAEYEAFASLFEQIGAEVHEAPADVGTGLDSVFVRDAAVICDRGAILCRMGKSARDGEPGAMERVLRGVGVPIVGRIGGAGRLEGGDVAWIDERTVAVGRGYRTNGEGIRQLRGLLGSGVDRVVPVPLPHWRGPGDVFHLMSMFSPVDRDLAVVYSPLLPVPFRDLLCQRGYQLVEVPDEEFETMGCNVLAVGPRRCVALEGNPLTRRRLEAAGAEVHVYRGREISTKGGGGPTCLTRPLFRA